MKYIRSTMLAFGKHKGETVQSILDDDPSYIVWMNDNIDGVDFADNIVEEAEDNDRVDHDEPFFWIE